MKKILTLAVVALMLALALVLPVSAAETPEYDEAELKAILTDAFDVYVDFFRMIDDIVSKPVKLFDFDDFELEEGKKIYDIHLIYAVRGGRYEKWDDFVEILESCYTDYYCERFIYESNVYNMDGYTASCISLTGAQNEGVWFEPEGMVAGDYEYFNLDSTFKIISVKGEKITAEFWVCYFDENPVRTETVEFTYTNKGWRVSGGSFFSKNIDSIGHFKDATAPQTGFATAIYAAVAVVSAAAVVAVGKKRR